MKRILILLAATLCTLGVNAQTKQMQLLSGDAQSLGMGGVAMTGISGSHAIYTNPAASIFARQKMQLSFSYMSLSEDSYYGASGFYNFDGRNLLQVGWRRYRVGYGGSSNDFGAGYSRRLGQKWSIGAVLRYNHYRDEPSLAADIGFMYITPLNSEGNSMLRLGGKAGNLGGYFGKSAYLKLPITGTVGGAIDTFISDAHQLTVGLDLGGFFEDGHQASFQLSAGAEYNLMQLIQLRAGYHYSSKNDYVPSYGSIGAGVRFLHARVDFAYLFFERTSPFRHVWNISVGFDF